MEDVLDVYTRPHDPNRVLVCLDETSKQLIAETRMPIPMKPGRAARVDYEYERNGTANLFMLFAPLEGWRHVKVTDRHTAIDYAQVLKDLADIHFPQVKTIVLVQDNLNIHSKASLYEAFPAPEARRLIERFEWHYTPKHGSWLDLAESELGVLSSQCLDRRIPDKHTLIDEIAAWEHDRNAHHTKANWLFTTKTARVKLKHEIRCDGRRDHCRPQGGDGSPHPLSGLHQYVPVPAPAVRRPPLIQSAAASMRRPGDEPGRATALPYYHSCENLRIRQGQPHARGGRRRSWNQARYLSSSRAALPARSAYNRGLVALDRIE